MKKNIKYIIAGIIATVLLIVCSIMIASADTETGTYGNFRYSKTGDEITITGLVDDTYTGALSIPETIDGGTVINICDYAFDGCAGLTEINIPNSVTNIGSYAFRDCAGLTEITIPNGVTSINDRTFVRCIGLTEIIIPDSITSIGHYVFSGCTGLSEITIPESITSIGDYAFANCTGLTEIYYNASSASASSDLPSSSNIFYMAGTAKEGITVVFSDSVETIPDYLFYDSNVSYTDYGPKITTVTIGNNVTSIGKSAFSGRTGLTEITIPDSVASIGNFAFYGCTSLEDINLPDGITKIGENAFKDTAYFNDSSNWQNGVLYISNHLLEAQASLSGSYIVKEGTVHICEKAFYNCSGLTEITIPDSVTSIGSSAFSGCTGLTEITIPDSVASIGDDAFSGCPLEYVKMGSGLTEIPSTLFHSDSLRTFIIGENVTSIGNYAFYDCDGLTEITIPDSVISIGEDAFNYCSGLTSITIPDSVTSIGNYAFYYCTGLTEITIPDSVTSIGDYAFSGCPLEYVKMGSGLTEIPSTLFHSDSLRTFIIGENVTSIGNNVFYNCTGLTEITIPDSVTSIGSSAFSGCTGLTEITIPDSVTSIGSSAFSGCTGLTEITIPDSVTSIGGGAFSGCPLEYVKIGSGLTEIPSTLIHSDSLKTFIIGENVTSIGDSAFSYCSGLTSITIPDSVISIGEDAFYNCTGLTEITIPDSVTSIGSYAFLGCTGLTSITIPDSVTSIGDYAFSGCPLEYVKMGSGLTKIPSTLINSDSLKTFIIGENVTSIGGSTFYDCTGLTEITIPESVTSIGSYAFLGCTGLTEIYYNASSASVGSDMSIISNVFNMAGTATEGITVVFSDSVETIPDYLFYVSLDCGPNITTVTIGNNVTSIGVAAFYNCTGLTEITIPDSVTSIGDGAFSGCPLEYVKMGSGLTEIPSTLIHSDSLRTFIIGENITSIGSSAFSNCTELTEITIPNSVTSIGGYAFGGCTGLTEITIPDSVTKISYNTFSGCTALADINLPDGITEIEDNAFKNTAYFNNPTNWQNDMLYIGKYLIAGRTSLTGSCSVKPGTTCIAQFALFNCGGIINLTVPDDVAYIGANAFYNVGNVVYNGTATGSRWGAKYLNGYVDGNLVYRDSSKVKLVACGTSATGNVIIPSSVDTIEDNTFRGCAGVTSVYIPLNTTRVGNYAFYGSGITEIYYEGAVIDKMGISIGDGNKKLTDATWHYSVPSSDMSSTFFTLAYNANGGANPPVSASGKGNITITSAQPTRSGYTFKGWAATADAAEASYLPGDIYNLSANTTLYAVWQKDKTPSNPGGSTDTGDKTYKAVFTADGKTIKEYELAEGAKISVPPAPAKEGYTFKGWSPKVPAKMPAKNMTFKAVFEKSEADKPDTSKAVISAPTGTKQINWKYKAQLVATATNLPEGCHIAWYEGSKKVSDEADYTTDNLTAGHKYTAKIVDSGGKVVSNSSQEKTVKVEVKSDFFSKIISFFSRLFGSDVTKI